MIVSRPIVAVSLAFALGCLLACWTETLPYPGVAVALVGCVTAAYCYRSGNVSWVILLFAVTLLGMSRAAQMQTPRVDDISRLSGRRLPTVISGYISSDPDVAEDHVRFIARVTETAQAGKTLPVTGSISVSVVRGAAKLIVKQGCRLEYGEVVRLEGVIQRPQGPRNPDEFDYSAYLARRGVYSVVWIEQPMDIAIEDVHQGSSLWQWAFQARGGIRNVFNRWLPPDEAALTSGMVLGSYSLVPSELVENFTRSGTLHLLAASGFNCGLIVAIFWHGVLRKMRIPRKLSAVSVILLLLFYVLMAGAGPSIVRAGVGASLYLVAIMIGRPSERWSILFGTALIMLLGNPLALFDVGFQLSFAAVVSILAFVPSLHSLSGLAGEAEQKRGHLIRRATGFLVDVAVVTLAATAATAPILAFSFNRFSLVSLPANVVVAALAVWHFWASVVFVFCFWIPGVNWVLSWIVFLLALSIEYVVGFAGSLSVAQINVSSPGPLFFIVWYGGLVGFWWALQKTKIRKPASTASEKSTA